MRTLLALGLSLLMMGSALAAPAPRPKDKRANNIQQLIKKFERDALAIEESLALIKDAAPHKYEELKLEVEHLKRMIQRLKSNDPVVKR